MATITHQYRGYTIRKVDTRVPRTVTDGGLNYALGFSAATDYRVVVDQPSGGRYTIERSKLKYVKDAIDRGIASGSIKPQD
jgi:hypothetical protein